MSYHWCVVPECQNTSIKTPKKLWIRVPTDVTMRNTWLKLAKRRPSLLSEKSRLYFCEDHFDLERDMENYVQYKLMGSVKKIRMKPQCIPTRFDCQADKKRQLTSNEPHLAKRKRMFTDEEIEEDLVQQVDGSGDEADAGATYFGDEEGRYYCQQSGDSQNLVSLPNEGDENSLEPTDMDTQIEIEIELEGVADNVVIKNEEADESTLVVEEPTLIKQEPTLIKQEPLDKDSLQTCHNAYDPYFEVIKHEFCDNSSEMKTLSENHGDLVTTKQEPPQAAVSLPADRAPTLEKPLAMVLMNKNSSTEEICSESKTQQSLQKAEDTDNCGLPTPRATRSSEKLFTCEHCLYKSVNKRNYLEHVRTHTGEKPYTCKHCDYKGAQASYLKTHMKTHTGEKPFTCNVCHYKCVTKKKLTEHMRTHTGEKPYSCKHCDYKGAQATNLKTHMRTHTGEKPYSCQHCDYKCARSGDLKNHMRTHTGEKPYTCNDCNYKCATKSTIMRHTRTHTREKTVTCNIRIGNSFENNI